MESGIRYTAFSPAVGRTADSLEGRDSGVKAFRFLVRGELHTWMDEHIEVERVMCEAMMCSSKCLSINMLLLYFLFLSYSDGATSFPEG